MTSDRIITGESLAATLSRLNGEARVLGSEGGRYRWTAVPAADGGDGLCGLYRQEDDGTRTLYLLCKTQYRRLLAFPSPPMGLRPVEPTEAELRDDGRGLVAVTGARRRELALVPYDLGLAVPYRIRTTRRWWSLDLRVPDGGGRRP